MVQRICPVCDQVMKKAHYCQNCRRRIRYPYVRDVTYHLNGQLPWDEGSGTKPPLPQVKTVRQAGGPGMEEVRRQRSGSGAVIGICLLAAAVSIMAFFSGQMAEAWRGMEVPTAEYDIDLGDYTGEETEKDYRELNEEAVAARGERCSARGHFAVQGNAMEQPVLDILRSAGLQIASQDSYSYNEVHDDGETWFTTWTSIELAGETEGGYQYVELDFDTGTGELHEISLSLEDPDRLAAVTCKILAALAEKGEIDPDAGCFRKMPEEFHAAMESGNGYSMLEGAVLIEGISYERSYTVYISHNVDSEL